MTMMDKRCSSLTKWGKPCRSLEQLKMISEIGLYRCIHHNPTAPVCNGYATSEKRRCEKKGKSQEGRNNLWYCEFHVYQAESMHQPVSWESMQQPVSPVLQQEDETAMLRQQNAEKDKKIAELEALLKKMTVSN